MVALVASGHHGLQLTPLNVHFILVLFFVVVSTAADTVDVGVVGLVVGLGVGLVVVFFVVKTVKGDVDGGGLAVVGRGVLFLFGGWN